MCDICFKWLIKEELGDELYPQVQYAFRFINSGVFVAVFHDTEHMLHFGTHESGAHSQHEPTVDRGMLTRALEKYNVVIGTLRVRQNETASALADSVLHGHGGCSVSLQCRRRSAVSAGAQVPGSADDSWPHGPQDGPCAVDSPEV